MTIDAPPPRDGRFDVRPPALSPSRANDYMQCPLLFRFRVVDRLPEPPSAAAVRGTLVHAVLDQLYDAPPGERTHAAAVGLLPPQWARLQDEQPDYAAVADADWLAAAGRLLATYFTLEDPNRLAPQARELRIEHQLADGPMLRGVIDRLDVAPDGAVRIVDYKTGKSPRPGYDGTAAFQMRFYGLMLWRARGTLPAMLQLVYLGDGQVLRAVPSETDLVRTEEKVRALWASITDAGRTGDFRPRRSALCQWCAHQALCPAFDGTAPEFDPAAAASRLGLTGAQAEGA